MHNSCKITRVPDPQSRRLPLFQQPQQRVRIPVVREASASLAVAVLPLPAPLALRSIAQHSHCSRSLVGVSNESPEEDSGDVICPDGCGRGAGEEAARPDWNAR